VNGLSQEREWLSAKNDYITCWKQPCVFAAGSEWSEKHPNAVAISVRMGVQSVLTDSQIKTVLTEDFRHYGVDSVRFFFEQNDAKATGVAFHIRGGTEGLFLLSEMRGEVGPLASRAKNTSPVFQLN